MKVSERSSYRVSKTRLGAASTVLALTLSLGLVILGPEPVQAQTYKETVLHSFANTPDGELPAAPLIRDETGNFYGTTIFGGAAGFGVVFKMNKNGKVTVLHSFAAIPDGNYPFAGLVRDASGNLYGTTFNGGSGSCSGGCGTVFKVNKSGHERVLYNFNNGTDGGNPYGGLILDKAENLYGVAEHGGTSGGGVVFKLSKAGKETVLYNFTGGADGLLPLGALILDAWGNLYGTTEQGGTAGHGTVFKLSKSGKETVLYSFTGGNDGDAPVASLLMDENRNLFGTTSAGGTAGKGTVFKLSKSAKFTSLYSFTGGTDGNRPLANLIFNAKRNALFGTTLQGGSGAGVVFKMTRSGKETVLYSFTGGTDGEFPAAALLIDKSGNLYSTAELGGASNAGVVFKLNPR